MSIPPMESGLQELGVPELGLQRCRFAGVVVVMLISLFL